MDRQQQHTIKSQLIEIRIRERKNARDVQDGLSDIFKKQLVPIMDEICSELVSENELVKIDRLVIDAGIIEAQKLPDDFTNLVSKKFRALLATIIYKARNGFGETGVEVEKIHFPGVYTAEESNREVLIYYLKNGRFPWWVSSTIAKKVEQLIGEARKGAFPIFSGEICSLLFTPNSRGRIIHHFKGQEIIEMLKHAGPEKVMWIEKGWLRLREMAHSGFLNKSAMENVKERYFDIAIRELMGAKKEVTQEESIRRIFQRTFKQAAWIHLSDTGNGLRLKNFPKGEKSLLKNKEPEIQAANDYTNDKNREMQVFPAVAAAVENEKVAVKNAGLILLWPYLEKFFSRLGLLELLSFRNDVAARRAVQLLHYIYSEEEHCEENELVLNKILCGMAMENFVAGKFKLRRKGKEECENLLKAVIGNWPVLKNTSIAAFRNTFLHKQGLLCTEANGWLLQVERGPVDILLDKLPWPVSVVKLPWNDHLIYVQW